MNPDIQWKQWFQNFDSTLILLRAAFSDRTLDDLSDLEQEGAIHRFKYTFELAWKTLKDYLEESGVALQEVTPRNVIKEAFAVKILPDGQVWIDMMLHRNRLSHTYDPHILKEALEAVIARYLPALEELHAWLSEQSKKDE